MHGSGGPSPVDACAVAGSALHRFVRSGRVPAAARFGRVRGPAVQGAVATAPLHTTQHHIDTVTHHHHTRALRELQRKSCKTEREQCTALHNDSEEADKEGETASV